MLRLTVTLLLVAFAACAPRTSPSASAGGNLPADGGRISGRVVDAVTGEAVSGARVSLAGGPVLPPRPDSPPPRLLVSETNAEGVFVISGIPPGRWRVQTQRAGYVPSGMTAQLSLIEIARNAVTVPDIRLERGGAVTGRILDSSGKGLSDVMVTAMQRTRSPDGTMRMTGGVSSAQSNDLGEFRLAGLAPGDHYLLARPRPSDLLPNTVPPTRSASRFVATFYPGVTDETLALPVTVNREATTRGLDFALFSAETYQVSGVVVDAGGRLVAGANVRLLPLGAAGTASTGGLSQADGTFRVSNVAPGPYMAVATIPVVVRNGIDTSLPGAGSSSRPLRITVEDADVSGLRLTVQRR
jgi:hypothetical protein